MATVTFTDQLAVNPGLEDVLDQNGTVTSLTEVKAAQGQSAELSVIK